jgi:serine/threonine protein kinase/WD40 repeat protein
VVVTTSAIEAYSVVAKEKLGMRVFPKKCICFFDALEENLVIVGEISGRVHLIEASSGNVLQTLLPSLNGGAESPAPSNTASSLHSDPNNMFASPKPSFPTPNGARPSPGSPPVQQTVPLDAVRCVTFFGNSRVAAGIQKGILRTWGWAADPAEPVDFVIAPPPEGGKLAPIPLSLFPLKGSNEILIGMNSGQVYKLNLETRNCTLFLAGHTGAITGIVSLAHLEAFMTISKDKSVRLWDAISGKELFGNSFPAYSLTFDPVRKLIFLGSSEGTLVVTTVSRDLTTNTCAIKLLKSLEAHKSAISYVWYGTKDDVLLTCAMDGTVQMWPSATGLSHDKAFASSPPPNIPTLSPERIEAVLSQLRANDKLDAWGSWRFDAVQEEDKLLLMALKIKDPQRSKVLLPDGSTAPALERARAIQADLTRNAMDVYDEMNGKRKALRERARAILNVEATTQAFAANKAAELAALRAKHAAEEQALLRSHDSKLEEFTSALPQSRRHIAVATVGLISQYEHRESVLETRTLAAMRKIRLELLGEGHQLTSDLLMGDPLLNLRGNTTSVHRAIQPSTGLLFAIKAFPAGVVLNDHLRHPCILALQQTLTVGARLLAVMPFLPVNLGVLLDRQSRAWHEHEVGQFIYPLIDALQYLHGEGLVHRDLRPENILIDGEGKPFLVHFGVMRGLNGREVEENGNVFAAPEILGCCVTVASDVWSLGAIIAYLLKSPRDRSMTPLFHGNSAEAALISMCQVVGLPARDILAKMGSDLMMQGPALELLLSLSTKGEVILRNRKPLSKHLPDISMDALDLLSRALQIHPLYRLSLDDILKHPWIQNNLGAPTSLEAATTQSRLGGDEEDSPPLLENPYVLSTAKLLNDEHLDQQQQQQQQQEKDAAAHYAEMVERDRMELGDSGSGRGDLLGGVLDVPLDPQPPVAETDTTASLTAVIQATGGSLQPLDTLLDMNSFPQMPEPVLPVVGKTEQPSMGGNSDASMGGDLIDQSPNYAVLGGNELLSSEAAL